MSFELPQLGASSTDVLSKNSLAPALDEGSLTSSLTGLGQSNQSLLFVDRSVTDYEQLLAGVTTGTEIHVLEPGQDAVTQITNTLLGRQNIASLHIVSHGEAGGVDFGSNALNLTDLPQYAAQLKTWSNALTNDADILFYGCNVAEGQLGQAFVQNISQLTSADVAASDDLTGSSVLGGDWTLEVDTGAIESSLAFQPKTLETYRSVLSQVGIGSFSGSNNAPSIDSASSVTVVEDIATPITGITFADVDAGDGSVTATFSVPAGTLAAMQGGGVTVGGTPSSLTLNGTIANINAFIAASKLTYLTMPDSNTALTLGVSINDNGNTPEPAQTTNGSLTINITPVNDAPTISTNKLSLSEGDSVVLSSSNINTTDPDNTADQLTYTASSISGGQFEFGANAGVAITSFTQAQIDASAVRFVHNGGETAPSYSLIVNDGSLNSVISTVTIGTFTNVNDAPTISTNKLSLSEGASVVLTSSNINATDPDNTAAQLTYTASSITGGRFELVATAGVAITSFTQPQINSGAVRFVHDGGETAPSYSLIASDGSLNSGSSTVAIGTFTNVNDAPTISTNSLSLSEGESVVLSSSNINATDPDNTAAQLTYTASSITGGQFELVATAGVAITKFTQAQINASEVRFVHNGGETAPSYRLIVNDGSLNSVISTVTIGTFTKVNDAPTISTNKLSLSEGASVVLTSSNINATDPDNTAAQLTYTASSISGGRFELVATAGVAITSFTQPQINSGAVRFVHDGGETAPSYSLIVSDGSLNSGSSTVAIGTFTNVNDAPTISTNSLSLSEGASVVLTSTSLNATDPDNTAAQLTYTASSITGGQFELVATAGVAITKFTQAQINASEVRFVHNGGETAPSYRLIVNDGSLNSVISTVTIGTFTKVNDAPTISTNKLSLSEGASVVLTSSNINATDPDNTAAQLTYTASSITGGRFELVATAGVAITSFTQAQINSGAVRFVHDGGETAPSYSLIANDGSLNSGSSTVAIGTFTNVNDAPTISTNSLSLSEGESVVLSSSNINATDPDNTAAQLTYTASSITGGQFELVATAGVAITKFTQAQINASEVRFVHNGGETAPSYRLIVNDGSLNSVISTVTIGTFTKVNDAPTISTNKLSLSEGASVVLTSTSLNATDPDNTSDQLTYTASSITGGQFELVATAGVAITSFTQAQINSGAVRFVHDGGETAPSYSLIVSDGSLNSGSSTVAIGTFTNVNDAPTISTNSLSLSEGESVVLSSSNINATDPDNTAAQLTYTASSITGGQFELVATAGVAITKFTQAQINASEVRFVHNGGETAPSYRLIVNDGLLSSVISTVTIGTFTKVNDAPTISTNKLSLSEGASVVLTSTSLNATDPDNTSDQLTYTASSITGGQFELVATVGVAITSFTQAEINSGAVRFVHDGGETAPSYSLIVSDGSLNSGSSTVAIGTYTKVNDAPTISTNTLSLSEGANVVLTSSNINATDPDNTAAQLTYTASSITGGRFELVAKAGVAITTFTQPQINSGAVRFVHNGSETAPSYSLIASDGSLNSVSSTVAIGTFTNVNDAPTISTNSLSLSEGESVVLSSSNINATDPDNTSDQLTYAASSISGGQFELVATVGVAITSFTQAEINSGAVRFVHDGGETAPSYSLIVSDGSLNSGSSTVAIGTYTKVNDAPTISTNTLSLSEGANVVLTSSNINATDPDNTAAQLTYTASSITGGRFELVAKAGVAITTFTQAQINSGAVRFVHNGGETAPSYSLIASDGSLNSVSSTVAIGTFTNVNDAPTISTNSLSLSEGESVVLSSSNINATDPDNTSDQLTYAASSISGGQFELVATVGVAITSFTQAEINSGAVRFVHDGGETAPSYSLIVSDGSLNSGSSTVAIGTYTKVNDAPTISTNTLSLSEGASVVLTSTSLNATDPDNTAAQLTYTASSITGGRFELVATAGVAITSFTQAEINSGAVRFVHDGGETAPSYSLIASDGSLNSVSSTVTIGTFTNANDAPTISTNSLSVSEGESVVLSSSNINATDPDNTVDQLTYTASSISGGQFEFVANPGVAITSFTQAEINSGAVRFVHDGGETAPSYSLIASDGSLNSVSSTVTIGTFTNVNDASTISTNSLSVSEGESVVLSSSNINATDPDNTADQLTYTASIINGGQFEFVANPGVAITTFTQAEINSGAVHFVHDGGETAPSYSLIASDGSLNSVSSTVTIGTFTNANDAPTISTNSLSVSEGESVVLSSSNINATDPDNTVDQLTYTASSISGGQFEFVANPGVAITSFTQAEINSGAVRFVHDGGETAPSYSLIASDGSLNSVSSTVTIGTFTNVNDASTISTNSLSVSEGESVVLSSSNINATDPDNTADQLTYTASIINGGQFEFVANPGVAITTFTQAEINSGAVHFVHDGGETAPSYSLIASDGSLNSVSSTVTIGTFTNANDAPTISTNSLSVSEGESVVLSSSNINATDPDNTVDQLTYTASSISGGQFEFVANPGVAITSFTQAEINSGAVRFVQDGSKTTPSYSLSVGDGLLNSGSSTVAILNNAPTLTGNATLAEVAQNTTNPSGSTLASLFGSLFSDPDTGASLSGLAIVGNTATTQGRWEYSIDGTTWASVDTVADDATALALSASTLVRFIPATGYNGTPPDLTVRALDNSYSGGFTNGTTRVTVNTTSNGGTTAISSIPADLDTSVRSLSDLLWRDNSSDGLNVVWQLDGFTFQSGYYLPSVADPAWQVASSTADFNDDGIADILWRNQVTGANTIWEMNSTGYETTHTLAQVDVNWQIVTTADFNRDSTPDILWRNMKTGENVIWQMNGVTRETGYFITPVADTNWQIAGTANFSGDSTPDILWRNMKTGENAIWQMKGVTRETGYFITPVADTNWQIASIADFNDDGTSDIVWRNQASGENAIWQMAKQSNGQASRLGGSYIPQVADQNWRIVGIADFNRDGTPDLLWYNKPAHKETIWKMSGDFSSNLYLETYSLPDVVGNWDLKSFVANLNTSDIPEA